MHPRAKGSKAFRRMQHEWRDVWIFSACSANGQTPRTIWLPTPM